MPEPVSVWVAKVKALQSLSKDIPDARIELIAEVCDANVQSGLGTAAYEALGADKRLEYAICAFTIAKLIISSREIGEGGSIHSATGWGEGEVQPSEVSEMVKLSRHWEAQGNLTMNQLKAEIPVDIGWVDI
ncbi:MAG: hypothetical protein PHY48_14035 [Candidatus Cloacimonetes bacterium]|nr:hypothetical protein [Candidatus Cloacimonadota bacterium]MDD2230515.1 hypothetical protein [Candidatus Cloacimonadota bacterium]